MSTFAAFVPSLEKAKSNDKSTFSFNGIRFSLLTERLIRVEISPTNQFEDRPTQQFWYRSQPVPAADINHSSEYLSVETEHFSLSYSMNAQDVPADQLKITLKENGKNISIDEENPGIFPGTTRTLDLANGAVPLLPGLISRDGWVQIDDTASLLFTESGWLKERPRQKGYRDLYFLISGSYYKSALQDYQKISGTPPLLPRAFLGNWWSRFWPYHQKDIVDLVDQFKEREFPFSVFIIDMDWHITKTGNQCSGWTGFSWNHDLIPEPEQLIRWLHKQNLITSMNLHPAEGIHAHEDQYTSAAKAMEMDPHTKEPIPFTIDDPKFTQVYFEKMLYPLENQGVDFWWIDWQQGEKTSIKGLDPLWWLNHLHFYDQGKSQNKRPVVFSRWGGPGNQRYPIGFSGDTYITWKSLAFQPYFTASAANTGYGWWSHDIGGHMHGIDNGELYARWLQFGVLSPIMRIHCANDPWFDHRPWAYGAEIERIVRNAMQFRHALIPYLYSMSRKNEQEGTLPITPLYFEWPHDEQCHQAENQYLFGTELMAAPVVTPITAQLDQARHPVWFPEGSWFDFFTGEQFSGHQWGVLLYKLDEIPLFAKAGAIIPLNHDHTANGCENPQIMDVIIFPAADGYFELYEDDGVSQQYKTDGGCVTLVQSTWHGTHQSIEILPAKGNLQLIPPLRTYHLHFRGVKGADLIKITLDGKSVSASVSYNENTRTLSMHNIAMHPNQHLIVEISCEGGSLLAPEISLEKRMENFLRRLPMKPDLKREIMNFLPELTQNISAITQIKNTMHKQQKIALIEELTGAAACPITSPTGRKQIVFCNPRQRSGFTVADDRMMKIPSNGMQINLVKKKYEVDYFDILKIKY